MNKDFESRRKIMVSEQIIARGIKDKNIINAFLKVPRHIFVKTKDINEAYDDHPLTIGHFQTISQPYIVAYMLEALALNDTDKVLEIGTGSGYQTALLAELSQHVYTIERIPELLNAAQKRLESIGYTNISYHLGDGTLGWPERQPFDKIIVSAGAPEIPKSLVNQLNDNGIIVIPVGNSFSQDLLKGVKKGEKLHIHNLGGCVFVRLIGKQGWDQ